jgi:hypothetical protein
VELLIFKLKKKNPGQIAHETLISKKIATVNGLEVQLKWQSTCFTSESPEFKPQSKKKKAGRMILTAC